MKKMLTFLMAAAISMGVAMAQDTFLFNHYTQNFSTVPGGDWGSKNLSGNDSTALKPAFNVNSVEKNLELRTGTSLNKGYGRTILKQLLSTSAVSQDSLIVQFLMYNNDGVSGAENYLYFCDNNKKPIFGIGGNRTSSQWNFRLPLKFVNWGDSAKNFYIPSANTVSMSSTGGAYKVKVVIDFVTKTYKITTLKGTYTPNASPEFVAGTAAAFVKADVPFLDANASNLSVLLNTIGNGSASQYPNSKVWGKIDDISITQVKPFLGNANVNVNSVDPDGNIIKSSSISVPIGQYCEAQVADFESFTIDGFYYVYDAVNTPSLSTVCTQQGANINLHFKKYQSYPGPLVWAAKTAVANWSENDQNFVFNGNFTIFQKGREVIFNGADTTQTIQIASSVDLVDKNMSVNKGRIIFNGVGNIKSSGNLNLDLAANDTIQILNANLFTGNVYIKGGVIRLAAGGFGSAKVFVENNATITLPYTSNKLNNEVNIAPDQVLTVAGTNVNYQGIGGKLTGSGNLKLIAYGARNEFSSDMSAWSGTKITMVAQAGMTGNQLMQINTTAALDGLATRELFIDSLVQVNGAFTSGNPSYAIGALSGHKKAVLGSLVNVSNGTNSTYWKIGGLNTDTEYAGLINESMFQQSSKANFTHIEKVGTGTLTLSNPKLNYRGGTIISQGTLILTGNITDATDSVNVSEGAKLVVIGKRELDLIGALTQTGGVIVNETKVSGILESDGGTYSGASLSMRYPSTLVAKVRNDSVAAVNFAFLKLEGGILDISPVKAYKTGDVFRVFPKELSDGSIVIGGAFGTILNSEKWDTSTLYTDGLVKALADGSSAIKEHKSEVKAFFTNGTLVVSGLQPEDTYSVVNTSGALVNANEKLQSGIYFVVVKTANGTFTRKAANFQVK